MKKFSIPKVLVQNLIAAGVFAVGLGGYASFQPSFFQQAVAASTQSATAVKEDLAQLTADQAALQRQLKRLQADQARLKSDTASGRMSAESKDAYGVYNAKLAVTGETKDIAADHASSRQMKSDEAALQRQMKRLDAAIARLKADTEEGKMSAMSKDSEKVYKDQQAVTAEQKQIATDKAKLKADQKK